MICQLAVLHSPSLVLIAAVISDRNRAHWDWLKWLPHNQHPHANDGLGSARMVYPSLAAAAKALAGLLPDRSPAHASAPPPLLVVVVDDDDDDAPRRDVAESRYRLRRPGNSWGSCGCG